MAGDSSASKAASGDIWTVPLGVSNCASWGILLISPGQVPQVPVQPIYQDISQTGWAMIRV